jgi:mRNA interferase RelE/StbE
MKYKLFYSKKANSQLKKLDGGLGKRIVKRLKFIRCTKNPLHYAKKLKDKSIAQYRFRIGDYRVLFDIDKKGELTILMILSVKHRKDIYKF